MKKNHNIIDKKTLYRGFFELNQFTFKHKKHDGSWSKTLIREVLKETDVATVLPYDSKAKKIILVDQFRSGLIENNLEPTIKEIIAGFIDKGESPEEAAIRECKEETGCSVHQLRKIFSYYPSPSFSQSCYHFFLAEVESFKGERIIGQEDEDEDLLARSYSTDEVKNMLNNGKIINGVTLIALQWFYLNYKII